MPIYEYTCRTCNLKTEKLVRLGEDLSPSCLKCGGAMEKIFSVPALQFNGSGFYETMYKKKSGPGDSNA